MPACTPSLLPPVRHIITAVLIALVAVLVGSGNGPSDAADFQAGNLQGTVYWNGAPVTGLTAWGMYVTAGSLGASFDGSTGFYTMQDIAVGTYTPQVGICCSVQLGQGVPTVVSAGATATADVDLTSTAGRVTGVITVNGVPFQASSIYTSSNHAFAASDSNGNFAFLLPPGSYTAEVRSAISSLLGTFTFSVTAGQTTTVFPASHTIGPGGGAVQTADGSVHITIPPGALDHEVTIGVTATTSPGLELTTNLGQAVGVMAVVIEPEGQTFSMPVTAVFAWNDDDNDGTVDGASIKEEDLFITKDNVAITDRCRFEVGCDTNANTFTFTVTSFSEFVLAALKNTAVGGIAELPDTAEGSNDGAASTADSSDAFPRTYAVVA